MLAIGILAYLSVSFAGPEGMARDMGAGATGLADPKSLGFILESPATIGLLSRYDLGGGYVFGPDQIRRIQVGAVDSVTAPVTLGIQYQRQTGLPQANASELPGWVEPGEDFINPKSQSILGGALAKSWNEGRVGLGLGVFYLHDISRFGGDVGQLNASVGASAMVAEQFTVSASVAHLVPYVSRLQPLAVKGGIHWGQENGLHLASDMRISFVENGPSISWGAGGGATIAKQVPLSIGFERDQVMGHDRIWGGVGWTSGPVQLDYSAGFTLQTSSGIEMWNGLSVMVHI